MLLVIWLLHTHNSMMQNEQAAYQTKKKKKVSFWG